MKAGSCLWRVWVVSLFTGLLLGSASAMALSLKPLGYFEAAGRLSLGTGVLSAKCDVRIVGEAMAAGRIRVDSAQFSGGNPACHRIRADKLPWSGGLVSADQLQLDGVTVVIKSLLFGGVCSALHIQAAINPAMASLTFPKTALPPNCRLEGTVIVTPALQVSP